MTSGTDPNGRFSMISLLRDRTMHSYHADRNTSGAVLHGATLMLSCMLAACFGPFSGDSNHEDPLPPTSARPCRAAGGLQTSVKSYSSLCSAGHLPIPRGIHLNLFAVRSKFCRQGILFASQRCKCTNELCSAFIDFRDFSAVIESGSFRTVLCDIFRDSSRAQ